MKYPHDPDPLAVLAGLPPRDGGDPPGFSAEVLAVGQAAADAWAAAHATACGYVVVVHDPAQQNGRSLHFRVGAGTARSVTWIECRPYRALADRDADVERVGAAMIEARTQRNEARAEVRRLRALLREHGIAAGKRGGAA